MKGNIYYYYAGFLAAALLVLGATGPRILATTATDSTQPSGTMNQTQTSQQQEAAASVALAQGSNATVQYYTFTPQTVEINVGQSVKWFSPAQQSEIHTVTFVLDPSLNSDIIQPFATSSPTDFKVLPPFNAGAPITMQGPDGGQAILALNKNRWYPTVLDPNNQTTYLNGTDIAYTMHGSERAINSGIIQPSAAPPTGEVSDQNSTSTGAPPMGPPFPIVSSFTVTFEKPGTYPYFCAIHPWMQGKVIVHGGEGAENQTTTEGGANQPLTS